MRKEKGGRAGGLLKRSAVQARSLVAAVGRVLHLEPCRSRDMIARKASQVRRTAAAAAAGHTLPGLCPSEAIHTPDISWRGMDVIVSRVLLLLVVVVVVLQVGRSFSGTLFGVLHPKPPRWYSRSSFSHPQKQAIPPSAHPIDRQQQQQRHPRNLSQAIRNFAESRRESKSERNLEAFAELIPCTIPYATVQQQQQQPEQPTDNPGPGPGPSPELRALGGERGLGIMLKTIGGHELMVKHPRAKSVFPPLAAAATNAFPLRLLPLPPPLIAGKWRFSEKLRKLLFTNANGLSSPEPHDLLVATFPAGGVYARGNGVSGRGGLSALTKATAGTSAGQDTDGWIDGRMDGDGWMDGWRLLKDLGSAFDRLLIAGEPLNERRTP
ncbi:hypothetical protein AXG93_4698s1210 [Marchantia polymorpha subsp. ruderalis]|uniref:Uncharacterized protein n=1 Tax=Marchantia polymorpha subsp. ruderalis TaxID=1480154 RepID=A0A176VJH0_MARPO|nr:hypothetical protein AXG93_4698s1210 [Marchantia polymorpha subsp. ruderalis]